MCGIGCVVTHWLQYNPHSTFLWDRCASLSLSPLKKSQKCVSQNQGSWGSRGGGRGWGSAQWDNCYKRHLSSQFPCVSLTTEIIKFWQLQFIFWHVFNMVSLSDCSFMWDIKRYSGYPLTSEISFFFLPNTSSGGHQILGHWRARALKRMIQSAPGNQVKPSSCCCSTTLILVGTCTSSFHLAWHYLLPVALSSRKMTRIEENKGMGNKKE